MRFPEFKGEWKTALLGDILTFKNGLNCEAEKYGKGIKSISVSDVLQLEPITYSSVRNSVEATEQQKEEFKVSYGDVLFQRSSETPEDIGQSNVYLDQQPCVFGGFVIRGKAIKSFNPLFFKYLMKTQSARREVIKRGAGAQHYNIGQGQLSSVSIKMPTKEEQRKISAVLQLIDKRIEVQRKTIEEQCALKDALQENLFEDFKNRKILKDAVQAGKVRLYRGKVIPKHGPDERFKYPVYSSSQENSGLMGYWDTYMLDEGLISWSIDGGGKFFYRPKHKFNITNVCGYIKLDPSSYDYYYCFLYLDWQFKRMHFDYVSKAHPSVIQTLYYLPTINKRLQQSVSLPFRIIDRSIKIEKECFTMLLGLRKYLLGNLFC